MKRGTVKWFDQEKNYGFLESDEGEEYFVHKSEVTQGTIDKGQRVEFEIGEGKKGPVARSVSVLTEE